MKIFTKLCVVVIMALSFAMPSFAQQKASLVGRVVSADTKQAVAYALVHFPETGLQAVTNSEGDFTIKQIAAGNHKMQISFLGYENLEQTITVKAGDNSLKFELVPANFKVEDVVVTATASKAGAATSSTISRTAMDHIQSSSLADVMSLLPGASTPDTRTLTLSQASSFSIRGGASLGTAIIMDGTPMSNNANLQSLGAGKMPFAASDAPGSAAMATPTSGVDMRQISTDNIESVEVIRGIASVEYGDITSGAVIVNSKAGRAPLNVKLTMNPNLYQLSATHGVQLGAAGSKAGALNYSADYSYSQYRPTEGYSHYERVNGQVGYTNSIGKWYTNSTLSVGVYRDKAKPTPGDENDFRYALQKEERLRFNTKGTLSFNKGWFNNLKYAASFTYTDKDSYFEDQAVNAEASFSTSKTNGAITTSAPGGKFTLENGSVITNPDGEYALRTPNAYMYNYSVRGKELNTYAQVIANFAGTAGRTSHFIKVGADFRNEGNVGEGKIFGGTPLRTASDNLSTQRERSYDDIPFMNTLGLFAEESFNWAMGRRNLNIVAGVRYDNIFGFDDVVAPRVNLSFDIIPEHLSIRGGYGITAKTPTLEMLNPQEAYFDLLNFNNSQSTVASEKQKFQVVTTHAFDTTNDELEMATTQKYEVGVDFKIGQVTGAITAFKDSSDNGYMFSTTVNSFQSVDMVTYEALYPEDGSMPALKEASRRKVLLSYATPTNNSSYETRGIEASIDFGRIDAIRTRFILDGVWSRTESWNNGLSFDRANSGNYYNHMGVFNARKSSFYENLSTNLKAVHNIPSIGFVISATANVIWREGSWMLYENDEIPTHYISVNDGKLYDFNESMLSQDEFKKLDVRPDLDVRRNIKDSYMSPVLCMNVNVTKEIKDFLRISFYANNAFRSTPLWESTKTPGSFRRRNDRAFFFGLSLNATIK
ncbi:MAG: TonB-dependent receptor [Rikenellaceae bacterium]|nr:TonB-dependent receptor [Rikenellaceae bacterium]